MTKAERPLILKRASASRPSGALEGCRAATGFRWVGVPSDGRRQEIGLRCAKKEPAENVSQRARSNLAPQFVPLLIIGIAGFLAFGGRRTQ
jgi:hypothetical protein